MDKNNGRRDFETSSFNKKMTIKSGTTIYDLGHGEFDIQTNMEERDIRDYSGFSGDFLDSVTMDDLVKDINEKDISDSGTFDNRAILNNNKTNPTSFAYFGSLRDRFVHGIVGILENFPASLLVTTRYDVPNFLTFSNRVYNPQNNTTSMTIPTSGIVNKYNINYKKESENLFSLTDLSGNVHPSLNPSILSYIFQGSPNTKYTLSTDIQKNGGIYEVFFGVAPMTPSSGTNGVAINEPRTITSNSSGVIEIGFRDEALVNNIIDGNKHIKLELGDVATPWEPNIFDIGAHSEIPNNVKDLRDFNKYYTSYELWDYEKSFNVLKYLFMGDTITLVLDGNAFEEYGDRGNKEFHVKPKGKFLELFKTKLDDLQSYLLNNSTTPKYTATFQLFEENSNGVKLLIDKDFTWATSDGYNLDYDTFEYREYAGSLTDLGKSYDEYKTNLILNKLIGEEIIAEDETDEGKFSILLKTYGYVLDDIKKYIDALAFINRLTYDKKDNIPDVLVKNYAKTLGLGVINTFSDVDLLDSITNTKPSQIDGTSGSLSPVETDIELWRRITMNLSYLFKSKGTRSSIEFILNMIGAPKGLIDIREYIYVAESKLDIEDNYGLPVDDEGYPLPLNNAEMYYHMNGGWNTQRNISPSNSSSVDNAIGIHEGDYDRGQKYIDNFINAGFILDRREDTSKTFVIYDENSTFDLEDSRLIINSKELETYLTPNRVMETEFVNWYNTNPNLLKDSNSPLLFGGYMGTTLSKSIVSVPEWGATDANRVVSSGGTNIIKVLQSLSTPPSGVVQSISCWFKNNGTKNINIYSNQGARNYILKPNELKLIEFKEIVGNGVGNIQWQIKPLAVSDNVDFTWWRIKVEEGREVTQWTPSPDDLLGWFRLKNNSKLDDIDEFYRNSIDPSTRKVIEYKGGYPILYQYYKTFLDTSEHSELEKIYDYLETINKFWLDLVEQFIPSTSIWQGGTLYRNNVMASQKHVYKHGRDFGSTFDVENNDTPIAYIDYYNIEGEAQPPIEVDIISQTLDGLFVTSMEFPDFGGNITDGNILRVKMNSSSNMKKILDMPILEIEGASKIVENANPADYKIIVDYGGGLKTVKLYFENMVYQTGMDYVFNLYKYSNIEEEFTTNTIYNRVVTGAQLNALPVTNGKKILNINIPLKGGEYLIKMGFKFKLIFDKVTEDSFIEYYKKATESGFDNIIDYIGEVNGEDVFEFNNIMVNDTGVYGIYDPNDYWFSVVERPSIANITNFFQQSNTLTAFLVNQRMHIHANGQRQFILEDTPQGHIIFNINGLSLIRSNVVDYSDGGEYYVRIENGAYVIILNEGVHVDVSDVASVIYVQSNNDLTIANSGALVANGVQLKRITDPVSGNASVICYEHEFAYDLKAEIPIEQLIIQLNGDIIHMKDNVNNDYEYMIDPNNDRKILFYFSTPLVYVKNGKDNDEIVIYYPLPVDDGFYLERASVRIRWSYYNNLEPGQFLIEVSKNVNFTQPVYMHLYKDINTIPVATLEDYDVFVGELDILNDVNTTFYYRVTTIVVVTDLIGNSVEAKNTSNVRTFKTDSVIYA